MRGERMAQRMASHGLDDARVLGGPLDDPAERVRMDMVTPHDTAFRIGRTIARGEDELPAPFASRARVFARERERQ